MTFLRRLLPILSAFEGYNWSIARGDVIAGTSVAVVLIPSVIAYGELAGVPPVHGLYAALAAMVGYALFASSRQVIAGPDAAISLLLASAIVPLSRDDPGRAATLGCTVAVLVGAIMFLAASLRLGSVADFLTRPVLLGYMTGAALILIVTQLGKLLGLRVQGHDVVEIVTELAHRIRETHVLTLVLGVGCLGTLVALRSIAPRVPGALVVMVVALGLSSVFDLEARGVRVIGTIDSGLPMPRWPIASLAEARMLLPAALGIAVLTFPDAVLLARSFAVKNGYELRPNQELRALGISNLAAGLFQGFSCGASQSRTTVNDASGGKTQVSSLVAAATLAVFLLFLTPLLRRLPVVALGSILVYAGVQMFGLREYVTLAKFSRAALALAVIVAGVVVVVGVIQGILVGVIASLVYVLRRLSRPMDAVMQEVPGTGSFHDLGDPTATQTVPGLIAYRYYAPLFFANADHFVERVRTLIAAGPVPTRWFLLDAQAVWEIDLEGSEALARLSDEFAAHGISFKIARANRPLRLRLERIGLTQRLGESSLFPSVHAAIDAFRREQAA
jgi:SulP family sulfate permease